MTDINRHIEEARALAKKIIVIENKDRFTNEADMRTAEYLCYKALKEQNKSPHWRKISEELPKIKEENYFINVKRKDNPIRVETLCIFAVWVSVKEYLEFYEVVEWKPID